ncbi:MAG: glutaredoxin domain-containing protein [Candidatus Paceibacterota bacterium]|jgi:glutaredoxin-like YruB-family protein
MGEHKVIVYSTRSCPYCIIAKEYLERVGVPFENKDVGKDPIASQEMVAKSGQMGVPVIEIDGEIIVGFDFETIEKLLS